MLIKIQKPIIEMAPVYRSHFYYNISQTLITGEIIIGSAIIRNKRNR